MKDRSWVVAYHLPTRTWQAGGPLSDYDQENYDLFVVMANDRYVAEKLGRDERRQCMRISGSARLLLDGLLDECKGRNTGEVIDIQPGEAEAAKRLQKTGLVEFVADGPAAQCIRLKLRAFNPCMQPDQIRRARAGQHKMQLKTPAPMGEPGAKPRL